MHGYDPAAWAVFFASVTGAAAALTGLLFVAVSINLSNILSGPAMLAARAAETLVVLLFVVISSALSLIPQDLRVLGVEILVLAVPLTVITVRNQLKFQRQNPDSPLMWSVSRVASSGVALVPGMIAGVSLYPTGAAASTGSRPPPVGHRRRRLQRLGPSGGDRSLAA